VDKPLATNGKAQTPLQDAQTLQQLKRGQWAAMDQLVTRYQDRLYSTVFRIVNNPEDAADLVQETFVKAMQNVARFEGKSSLYTWLFRIAVNLAISHRRAGVYRHDVSLDADLDTGDSLNQQASGLRRQLSQDTELDPGEEAGMRMDHQRIIEALSSLDAEFRAVIVLRDVENCDYEQIAEIIEVPVGTIKSRLFRARAALRDALQTGESRAQARQPARRPA
jgi:RNA polymerase sigma-70 factor (ECF subfamily)